MDRTWLMIENKPSIALSSGKGSMYKCVGCDWLARKYDLFQTQVCMIMVGLSSRLGSKFRMKHTPKDPHIG